MLKMPRLSRDTCNLWPCLVLFAIVAVSPLASLPLVAAQDKSKVEKKAKTRAKGDAPQEEPLNLKDEVVDGKPLSKAQRQKLHDEYCIGVNFGLYLSISNFILGRSLLRKTFQIAHNCPIFI